MAGVAFRTVWLNLAADLSQSIAIPFVTQITPQPKTPADFRVYGNGRSRLATAGYTLRQQSVAAVALTPAQVALLLSWTTQTVLYRDDWGTKFFGAYLDPSITRHSYDVNADVSLTVNEVSHSEVIL